MATANVDISKVPKIVREARNAMEGKEYTIDNMMSSLSKGQMNTLGNTMRQSLSPEKKIEYADKSIVPDDDARRQ